MMNNLFGFGFGLGNRSLLGHRGAEVFPNEVNRNPGNHDDQARPGGRRLVDEKNDQDYRSAYDVQNRDQRITECLIRALRVRTSLSQTKDAGDGENIKDQRRGYYVIQKIAVQISITRYVTGSVVLNCTREDEHRGPDSLDHQTPGRDVLAIELAG